MRFPLFIPSLVLSLFAAEPGMVFIPGGEFQRGRNYSLPDDGLKWVPYLVKDDRPVRPITLTPYYLDEHEVTNAEYAKFVRAKKHRSPYNWPKGDVPAGKENVPVADISWEDAAAFAKWAGKRLPTEAEWERACRGLSVSATYPWGDAKADKKLARFDAIDGPAPVCQFPKNSLGLCDMAGNVWEWVSDWYEREYYANAPAKDPSGPGSGMYRVLRGGSWADEEKYLRCAYRSWARPAERSPNIGFRCAKSFP